MRRGENRPATDESEVDTVEGEMRALVVRRPWIDLILSGRKTWEIRGSSTRVRGLIALIESGSGTVVGVCELRDALGPLTLEELRRGARRHRGPGGASVEALPYRRTHAWVVTGARRLLRPVPYRHPLGAVVWVRLDQPVVRKVRRALSSLPS